MWQKKWVSRYEPILVTPVQLTRAGSHLFRREQASYYSVFLFFTIFLSFFSSLCAMEKVGEAAVTTPCSTSTGVFFVNHAVGDACVTPTGYSKRRIRQSLKLKTRLSPPSPPPALFFYFSFFFFGYLRVIENF